MPVRARVSAPYLATKLHFSLGKIESGLPLASMAAFLEASGVALRDIYDVVIPARTLKHRRAQHSPLSPDESDKLARLARIFDQAVAVFGDTEHARHWLTQPKNRFDHRTPINMLRTEIGGRMVEEMLGQIDEGMFA